MKSPILWLHRATLLGALLLAARSARAQGAPLDAAAGVRPPALAARATLTTPDASPAPARHTALGATIGVAVGVAAVAIAVERCKPNYHGEGPPCELGYFYYGPFAVLGGGLLGGLIGHSWPEIVEAARSRQASPAIQCGLTTC